MFYYIPIPSGLWLSYVFSSYNRSHYSENRVDQLYNMTKQIWAPNETNLRLLKIIYQDILAHRKVIFKNPRLGSTSDIPARKQHNNTRDGRFGSKVGQIGPKWDKSGAFSDQISVHLAPPRQMHWNLIWKSHGFVPYGANLTHFGAKPTIPGVLCHKSQSQPKSPLEKRGNIRRTTGFN